MPGHAVCCCTQVSQDHGGASGNGRPSRSAVSSPCRSHKYALGTPPFVSFIEGRSEQSRQCVSTRSLIFSLSSLSELPSGKVIPAMRTGYRIWFTVKPTCFDLPKLSGKTRIGCIMTHGLGVPGFPKAPCRMPCAEVRAVSFRRPYDYEALVLTDARLQRITLPTRILHSLTVRRTRESKSG
jgi:hypothetical protein